MNEPVPLHLRNAVTDLMRNQDYGKGYQYAHDYEGGFTPTQNLPDNLKDRRYYKPSDYGYEFRSLRKAEPLVGQPRALTNQNPFPLDGGRLGWG